MSEERRGPSFETQLFRPTCMGPSTSLRSNMRKKKSRLSKADSQGMYSLSSWRYLVVFRARIVGTSLALCVCRELVGVWGKLVSVLLSHNTWDSSVNCGGGQSRFWYSGAPQATPYFGGPHCPHITYRSQFCQLSYILKYKYIINNLITSLSIPHPNHGGWGGNRIVAQKLNF